MKLVKPTAFNVVKFDVSDAVTSFVANVAAESVVLLLYR